MQNVVEPEVRSDDLGKRRRGVEAERATKGQRTLVIVLAQVVVLAAIVAVWSFLRSKRKDECCGSEGPDLIQSP